LKQEIRLNDFNGFVLGLSVSALGLSLIAVLMAFRPRPSPNHNLRKQIENLAEEVGKSIKEDRQRLDLLEEARDTK